MAGLKSDSEEMITGINVTPLVDVVLVLLVIFMITAPAIYQSAIKVELPKAISGEKSDRVTLKFVLMKNGSILMGRDNITREKIPEIAKMALLRDPTANAVIAADSLMSHGEVITFIDLLKSNGVSRFAIGVEAPQGSKGSTK